MNELIGIRPLDWIGILLPSGSLLGLFGRMRLRGYLGCFFFTKGTSTRGLNTTFIVLIPKKGGAED